MKKLHSLVFYALVTPALTLGAGSVLAQYTTDQDSGRAQQSTQVNTASTPNTSSYDQHKQSERKTENEQRKHRDQSRSQNRGHIDAIPTNGMHASNLIGADVQTRNDDDIGSVDDLVIDKDGQVVAIIVSVGGFLGMGQKDVAIGWDNVTRSGTSDNQELRVDVSREQLNAAPTFEKRDQSRTARSASRDQSAQQGSQQRGQQQGTEQRYQQGSQQRTQEGTAQRTQQDTQHRTQQSGQQSDRHAETNRHNTRDQSRMQHRGHISSAPSDGMHASNLIGTNVRTNDNEDIGSVDDLVIDDNGRVVAILVSVGGFLGMGQKDVAIGWDNVTRSGSSDKQELRVDVTRDDLRAAPTFAGRN